MTNDHMSTPHAWGYVAECPGCRRACNCGDLVRSGMLPRCVYCKLADAEKRAR